MELKESAYLFIGSFALFLTLGYITASVIFFFSSAILLSLIALDYALLRYRLALARRHITVHCSLSHKERAPGRQGRLEADIAYSGPRRLMLSLSILADEGISVGSLPGRISLSPGLPVKLAVTLTPWMCGEYSVGPAIGSVETMLLKASFPLGERLAMGVRLPIGRQYLRPNSIHHHDRYFIVGDVTMDKKSGSDFFGIRNYVPGDNIRRIDWTRTIKYRSVIIKEFESMRSLPTFFLMDVSIAGRNGEPGISPGMQTASTVIDKLLSDTEPVGLICFSQDDIVHYARPDIGRSHIQGLKKALSEVRSIDPIDSVRQNPLQLQELYDLGKEYDKSIGHRVLEPLFEETLRAYSANIRDDGFARAIRKAIEAADGEYNIIVITALSMGMASLSNSLRLASYYGHHVTVILVPPAQHNDDTLAYAAAASKLRSRSINVMVVQPGETTNTALYEGRVKSRTEPLRW
jgi:hypothetical protein